MSPDPLSVHAAAADLNVYAYVGGRVASHVDPWGLEGVATDTGGPNGNTFWSFPSTSGSYTTTSERTTTTVSWSYQSPLAGFAARMLQEAVVIAERGLDGLSQNADLLGPLAGDAVSLGNKLAQPGANITPGGVLEGVYEEAGSAGIRQVLKLPDIGIRSGGPGDVGPEVGRFGARYGLASLVGAGEAAAERAAGAEGGGAVELFHGTTEEGANSIKQGLRAVSRHTAPFPKGSFFTHAGGPDAQVAASHWAASRATRLPGGAPTVLRGTLPRATFDALSARGLIQTGPVPGLPFFPAQTVILPEALGEVSRQIQWTVVPLTF